MFQQANSPYVSNTAVLFSVKASLFKSQTTAINAFSNSVVDVNACDVNGGQIKGGDGGGDGGDGGEGGGDDGGDGDDGGGDGGGFGGENGGKDGGNGSVRVQISQSGETRNPFNVHVGFPVCAHPLLSNMPDTVGKFIKSIRCKAWFHKHKS